MPKLSEETKEFIRSYVLQKMNLTELTEENYMDVSDYIYEEIEGPLADCLSNGDKLTAEEQDLLNKASTAVTELTSDLR